VSQLGSRSDVPDILRQVDIGILASASEGLPLSLLEYGLAGLPVVVTDVGQCSEVVDAGRAGLLVPPRDPESLAGAVGELLESPARRTALGNALRHHVDRRFGKQAVLSQLCGIYHTILSHRLD
jgi:glycosyltransferase involved in cell wall biosynthesis